MTTTIFDSVQRQRSKGRDLNVAFRWAKRCGGVKKIQVENFGGSARVTVVYVNGWQAVTMFASYGHARDWAVDRSKLGKASWFYGCEVELPQD